MFLYEVKIDGSAYHPSGPPAIPVVADSIISAMNAACKVYEDRHGYCDSNDVTSVVRGQSVAAVA